MDDFKEKDELNGIDPVPQEEETVVPDELDLSDNGEASAPEDADGIMITEEQNDSVKTADEPKNEMCILCGENPADKSFGESYDLCAQCRKRLLKSPLRFSGILALIVVLAISAFGLLLATFQTNTLKAVTEGDGLYSQNKLYSAITSYNSAPGIGWKTARRLLNCYNQSGYLSGINNTVAGYFYDSKSEQNEKPLTFADKVGKGNLNAPWNKAVKKIYTEYTTAMKAYEKYYAFISEYDEKLYYGEIKAEDVPYDELIGKFEDAKKTEKTKEGLAFINYCEYYLASKCEKSDKAQLDYLLAVEKAAPEMDWLYLTTVAELCVKQGDDEAALKYADRLEKKNADDKYGEYFRIQILRKKGNYEEALSKLQPIIDDFDNNGFYYAYYEAAINALMLKDYEKAFEYIDICFTDQIYLNYDSVNFYALCCKLLNKDSAYDNAVAMLEQNEMEVSPTVEKYLSGEMSAQQIFNEGEVDFE